MVTVLTGARGMLRPVPEDYIELKYRSESLKREMKVDLHGAGRRHGAWGRQRTGRRHGLGSMEGGDGAAAIGGGTTQVGEGIGEKGGLSPKVCSALSRESRGRMPGGRGTRYLSSKAQLNADLGHDVAGVGAMGQKGGDDTGHCHRRRLRVRVFG